LKAFLAALVVGAFATETHATHVSGIVAGADNGLGIVGVAPGAKLKEARVLETHADGSVSGETSEVMAARRCRWSSQPRRRLVASPGPLVNCGLGRTKADGGASPPAGFTIGRSAVTPRA
jgi:subtilase family protein